MDIIQTPLAGVLLLKPDVWGDNRGYFVETRQAERYAAVRLFADLHEVGVF